MKAWIARERGEFCAAVVFAETRGKAKSIAKSTDACEDVDFLDIEVHRLPEADKHYSQGVEQLYWDVPEDRLILVKEFGFSCDYDALYADDCVECPAKDYCYRYRDYRENADEA